ncbi:hypothetical protein BJY16_006371 [Actinoplanes octamycinicus]|uniref:Uncharacterized protein n=1 Tax=Actinoplanes octamycinicus TaxID=135948 RepID=A0A7W7H3D0_9ACTN|nr:hypothetical protein [Actinoplanes octamycinicus]MBB4742912.1 hypothetical protein [Actinoplanes octamycinicus]GIE58235.1 hypothetical protein Aoc01nite_36370 [Actinoplanes octamycinicus]
MAELTRVDRDISIMNVALMLLREPGLLAIWLLLLVLAGPALVVLASPEGVREPGQALRQVAEVLRRYREQQARSRQQAEEVLRYAGELDAAAAHAATTAQRWHEHWQQAQQCLDTAWQAWLDADARLSRARAAAAFSVPQTGVTPAQYAERERFLRRAVLAAARHGELPIAAVADALAGRNGWNPRLQQAEQELHIYRASAAYLARRYRQAAAAERVAWHDAQLAAATRDGLRAEAAAAATQSAAARRLLTSIPARRPAKAQQAVVTRAA